jgi:hypothetical protein
MLSPASAALRVVGIANQQLYRRRRPEQTALYPVIETNLTPFLEYLHEPDSALLRFVTDEFKGYLRCGRLECGWQAHDLWSSGQVRDLCFVVVFERASSQSSINWEGERPLSDPCGRTVLYSVSH